MGLRCKRCGSEEQVKNGLMRSKQRYRCKACGLNFTDTPARGKPLALKATAVLLYVSGLSMNRTAKLLGVSTPTIQTHGIERDNARQRHWLARFRRRSIVVSKTKRMVDVSLALFARFAGNSRFSDLLSMQT